MLEPWLQVALDLEWDEDPISNFTHRLSASPTLDCLARWKHDQEFLLKSKNQPPPADGADGTSTLAISDPMQFIDWGFMDDFNWNFDSNTLSNGT